ncbi:MAG TPA: class II aldolase/adducin family protein [Caulobacteraceae bacterium]|nr:class II aldolase/adducin family protein [Caulobacteraceae bacterium]
MRIAPAAGTLSAPTWTPEEWAVRVDLAACYRLVAYFGWDDLIATHISVRVPNTDGHFLLNPLGLMFEEMTASALVKVDMDGNILEPTTYSVNAAGFTIHSAVHMAREDAHCVMHLHSVDGTAVSTMAEGIMPLNQKALYVRNQVAYHDYEGIAFDADERPRLQRDLGDKNLMLLRNHGTLAVGETIADAFLNMYNLERACTLQIRTLTGGQPLYPVAQEVIEKVAEQSEKIRSSSYVSRSLVWPAMLRLLARHNPGYDA